MTQTNFPEDLDRSQMSKEDLAIWRMVEDMQKGVQDLQTPKGSTPLLESAIPSNLRAAGSGYGVSDWEFAQSNLVTRGPIGNLLTLLAERMISLYGGLYGGQFGHGIGDYDGDRSNSIRTMAPLMWVFPEYLPLVKRAVSIRPLYVFGQGYKVSGESKRKMKRQMKLHHEEIARKKEEMAAMQGGANALGGNPNGTGAPDGDYDIGRDAMFQRNGNSGGHDSAPRFESAESFLEGPGPVGAGQQGGMESPAGPAYSLSGSGEESKIAENVREFWEDACNKRAMLSVEAMMRNDTQAQVEGNVNYVMMKNGVKPPRLAVWRTSAVQRVIRDNLWDGNGEAVGYLISMPFLRTRMEGETTGENRPTRKEIVIPDMVADDPERLKKILEANSLNYDIDPDIRLYHYKEWGPSWSSFGLPTILPGIQDAVRHSQFLEDWAAIQKNQRAIGTIISGMSGNQGMQQVSDRLVQRMSGLFAPGTNATLGENPSSSSLGAGVGMNTVGMGVMAGMTQGGIPSMRVDQVRSGGIVDPPQQARDLKLMMMMAVGYPESMYSDSSTPNMSQAMVLERTTQLDFKAQQQKYETMFTALSKCAIKFMMDDEAVKDTDISVTWPPILAMSPMELMGTIIQAYQGDAIPRRVMVEEALKALNREDMAHIMNLMFAGEDDGMEFKSDNDMDMQLKMGAMQPGDPATDDDMSAMFGNSMGATAAS